MPHQEAVRARGRARPSTSRKRGASPGTTTSSSEPSHSSGPSASGPSGRARALGPDHADLTVNDATYACVKYFSTKELWDVVGSTLIDALMSTVTDEEHMRRAIALAALAREHGNHPFGALVVHNGAVVCEAENSVTTENDCTNHAETNLVRKAVKVLTTEQLREATLFTSTEPCAMCAGAIYWAGIANVVYGLPEQDLYNMTGGDNPDNPTLLLPCRDVFKCGGRTVQVRGPVLREEAAVPHKGFWQKE